jgi:hypothetical protein
MGLPSIKADTMLVRLNFFPEIAPATLTPRFALQNGRWMYVSIPVSST